MKLEKIKVNGRGVYFEKGKEPLKIGVFVKIVKSCHDTSVNINKNTIAEVVGYEYDGGVNGNTLCYLLKINGRVYGLGYHFENVIPLEDPRI